MHFPRKPPLTIPLILKSADAHHARTGTWPRKTSGPARAGYIGDNWLMIDHALKLGLRGLDGGTTLAKLLSDARGVRSPRYLSDPDRGNHPCVGRPASPTNGGLAD
jgi:hypothetical protein